MSWFTTLQDTLHPPRPRSTTATTTAAARPLLNKPRTTFSPTRLPRRLQRRIIMALFAAALVVVGLSAVAMARGPARVLDAHNRALDADHEQLWRRFPKLANYYGGMFSLVAAGDNVAEYPRRPAAKGRARGREMGAMAKSRVLDPYARPRGYVECSFGERERPEVRVFDGVPEGMPEAVVGSAEVLGVDDQVCFERYGRLGGYGYGYSAEEGGLGMAQFGGGQRDREIETAHGVGGFPLRRVNWTGVEWGALQSECGERNRARFEVVEEDERLTYDLKKPERKSGEKKGGEEKSGRKEKREDGRAQKQPRTALLLRTWTGHSYTLNEIAHMRSLVSELSLLSGGEYTVHILMHVKDRALPIFTNETVYRETVAASGLPEEFWGITVLWNEALMETLYAAVPDDSPRWREEAAARTLASDERFRRLPAHGVYRSTFMPVQWFSQRHPEYDFVWNWELDVRYTGHWHRLFSQLDAWTAAQPRAGLWDRNARYYVPAVHGDWPAFSALASAHTPANETVLGPVSVPGVAALPTGPVPPTADASAWGVGEPADLVTLNPMFDPSETSWILRDDYTGYPAAPPRRAVIVAAARLSRTMLAAMHAENTAGRAMFSEMFPASVALHRGLKAVYAPHPMWVERRWPLGFLERTLNNGVGGAAGGRKESVFGTREHNFRGTTWFYSATFAGEWYKAWHTGKKGDEGEVDRAERGGRMCLPAVLVHPVKGQ